MDNKTIKIWEPFRDLVRLEDDFGKLFNVMFNRLPMDKEGMWVPVIDIAESNGNIEVKAEIPGVEKENLKVAVNENMLTISGERKQESETKDKRFHRIERYYGSFSRTIALPDGVNAEKVKASYKDGVLHIVLPKPESVKPKEIKVEMN
jgi:HSP20 family protein